MLIGAVVVTAAIFILLSSARSTTTVEQSLMAYQAAESGIEEGVLKILRADYTGGSGTNFSYTVAADGTINSTGTYNGLTRKIAVTTTYNSGTLTITSWQETY